MGRFELSARDVAFVAIFAALSVITVKVIPGVPIVGVPGASIKFDVAVAPIYGLVVGPYLGFLAAFVGGLIAAGSWFSVLTSFSTAVSALVAGLLTQRTLSPHSHSVRGWMVAGIILCLLILGWYMTWVGQRAPFYPVLHFSALMIILVTRGWIATSFEGDSEVKKKKWQLKPSYALCGILTIVSAYVVTRSYLESIWFLSYLSLPLYFAGGILILYGLFSGGRAKFAVSVCLASYCGIIADHMLGNLVFINVIDLLIPMNDITEYFLKPLNLPDIPSLFMYMIPVSIIERIIFTAIATLIGVGLVLTLRKSGLLPRILQRPKKD
ncbi:MAG: ECF transporter S component [Candidatus Bathyarchaeota archaeon]|nr:MAG: ECF transporter S component [Candidatus Bathyarchaeota archaeon]